MRGEQRSNSTRNNSSTRKLMQSSFKCMKFYGLMYYYLCTTCNL
jgi:hypothetical protein